MNAAAFIRKYVMLNIPYLLFFWLAGKAGEAYRLAPGIDAGGKVLNLGSGFAAAFQSWLPSFHPQDLLVGIIGAAAIWFAVWNKKKNAKKFRKDVEYGSAGWAIGETSSRSWTRTRKTTSS